MKLQATINAIAFLALFGAMQGCEDQAHLMCEDLLAPEQCPLPPAPECPPTPPPEQTFVDLCDEVAPCPSCICECPEIVDACSRNGRENNGRKFGHQIGRGHRK